MKLKRQVDGWWIVEVPSDVSECGPYDRRAEAEDDMRGMTRCLEETAKLAAKQDSRRKMIPDKDN